MKKKQGVITQINDAVKFVCRTIDEVNDGLGKIFSVLVLGVLGVIMCEVVMRRIFNQPQIWTQELTVMLFACYTILICAYGFQKKAFVAVDVVFAKLPQTLQYIIHLITYGVFLVPFVFWITPRCWDYFMRAYQTNEMRYSVWQVPTWPVKLCFFLGFALLAVQAVSEMLKQVTGMVDHLQNKRAGKRAAKALPANGEEAAE